MKFSLKSQLSAVIALIVLLTVALISFLSNELIQDQFKSYLAAQQRKTAEQLVESISLQYDDVSGLWDTEFVHAIGMNAMNAGYMIRVTDRSGGTVWDAQTCDMTLCTTIMDDISHRMMTNSPDSHGEFTTKTYPAMQSSVQVGTVSISYYGPFFLNEDDFLFLKELNRILLGIGVASLFIALATGVSFARYISRPLMKTMLLTQEIAAGNYEARITEREGSTEIRNLTGSINHMAEVLEQQENLRKQLTADVAHELRTPLTTVQTHIEAMVEGVWEPTCERLESCYEELSRLSVLVNDLENLAKVESANLSLEKNILDLRELVEKVLSGFEKERQEKNLKTEVSGFCQPIVADGDRIRQVCINLISNAFKYTPEEGSVTVTLSDAEDSVIMAVNDNGMGISEEELPFVFERFYRADKSRNRNTGGSGIGLAIVKSIVRAHGGTIRAYSKRGEGSTFTVILPKE